MPGIPQREMGRRGVGPAPVKWSVLELKTARGNRCHFLPFALAAVIFR